MTSNGTPRSALRGNAANDNGGGATNGANALLALLGQQTGAGGGTTTGGAATNGMLAVLQQLATVDPSALQGVLDAAAQAGLRARANEQRGASPVQRRGVSVLTPDEAATLQNGGGLATHQLLQRGGRTLTPTGTMTRQPTAKSRRPNKSPWQHSRQNQPNQLRQR